MTYLAEECPCCGSTRHTARPALVSPFIAAYVLKSPIRLTRLLECLECRFRFFEDRFTDAEASVLYTEYRGDRYFRERHRYEPWYSRKLNDSIGGDENVIQVRRALVEQFLREHVDVSRIEDVLDFGGDRGQLMPRLGVRRFVFEISGIDPVPGVTRIANAEELRGRTFDLVLLSHVLEHCSDPHAVLLDVLPRLRSEASLFYVELPFERTDLRWTSESPAYRGYLEAVSRSARLAMAVDLYSTGLRAKWNVVPPLGFLKMHEHINFFDEGSLGRLLARSGLRVQAMSRRTIRSNLGSTPVLCAVASKL